MADLPAHLFAQLRSIVGGYLVDVILEAGTTGVVRLIREGLEHKARLTPEEDEKVMQIVRRLEEGRDSAG
ncbi:MAG: hypothetical protein HYZ81_08795 [Nitrospinae bacterium]|nr:hypothetical protein [Nitrospinota bacterium]